MECTLIQNELAQSKWTRLDGLIQLGEKQTDILVVVLEPNLVPTIVPHRERKMLQKNVVLLRLKGNHRLAFPFPVQLLKE